MCRAPVGQCHLGKVCTVLAGAASFQGHPEAGKEGVQPFLVYGHVPLPFTETPGTPGARCRHATWASSDATWGSNRTAGPARRVVTVTVVTGTECRDLPSCLYINVRGWGLQNGAPGAQEDPVEPPTPGPGAVLFVSRGSSQPGVSPPPEPESRTLSRSRDTSGAPGPSLVSAALVWGEKDFSAERSSPTLKSRLLI